MRLIDLDAIMAQFPDADFDGDVIENMKAYPYWKIGIDGLINVLKAVPIIEQSEDCVSREEALKVMCDKCPMYNCVTGCSSYRHIEKLPSVQPQPKKGKWEVIRKEYEFMGSVVNEPQGCKCSNCGGIVKFKSDFCPNCGADMRGESE